MISAFTAPGTRVAAITDIGYGDLPALVKGAEYVVEQIVECGGNDPIDKWGVRLRGVKHRQRTHTDGDATMTTQYFYAITDFDYVQNVPAAKAVEAC